MSVTLGLSCIVKDEITQVLRIINDYSQYFDELCFAIDDKTTFEEINKIGGKVFAYEYDHRNEDGLLDFAHKRNFIMEKSKCDFLFRLDMDDEIKNPELIRDVVNRAAENDISIVNSYYDYSRDEFSNTNAAHYRETIFRNNGTLFWNKAIHENILPYSTINFKIAKDDGIKIKHLIDFEHSKKSLLRNLEYLIKEYNRTKDEPDPRTLAYLGRSFMGVGDFKKARYFLEQHIQKSGWDDDRYLSWCQIAHITRLEGDFNNAFGAVFEALQEKPNFPDAYFEIHDTYFTQGKWDKAIEWANMGFQKEFPKTNMLFDPSAYTWRPMLSLALCYYNVGEFGKAKKVFNEAKKYVPTLAWVKENEKMFESAIEHQQYIKNLLELIRFLKDKKDNLTKLVESIPEELWEHDIIASIRKSILPPKTWNKNSVIVYCGHTTEEWSPKSVEKGIGGSEEAVICLSRELAKLGYEVIVYNNCGKDEGIYDGVQYLNHIRFNSNDRFNILISWRSNIFVYNIQARNKIIWLHDLVYNIEFSEDAVKTFDKIIALSQYHASILPEVVPKEKIFLSTNGIVPEDFVGLENIVRQSHRMIFASSYNRGLEQLLEMWSDIKKEVADAEIHIYYGWDVYEKYVREGFVKDNGFKARMFELMKQEGVFEHGRIGHKELLKEYAKSGVFAYPCTYAGEINCLALTKAIACGCQAVTNQFAVLKERNLHFAVPDDNFKDMLIRVLKGEYFIKTDIHNYIQSNSWQVVAEDWSKNLFPVSIETEVIPRSEWILSHFIKDDKIIDIGSNNGQIFEVWDRKNITSVDLDLYDIANFVRADAKNLPFEDKKFDGALLAEILEHNDSPVQILKEAKRVARKVIITVPYEYEWREDLKPLRGIKRQMQDENKSKEELAKEGNSAKEFYTKDDYEHLWHKKYYTPETLTEDIKLAGFENFKITKIRQKEWVWLGAVCTGDKNE